VLLDLFIIYYNDYLGLSVTVKSDEKDLWFEGVFYYGDIIFAIFDLLYFLFIFFSKTGSSFLSCSFKSIL